MTFIKVIRLRQALHELPGTIMQKLCKATFFSKNLPDAVNKSGIHANGKHFDGSEKDFISNIFSCFQYRPAPVKAPGCKWLGNFGGLFPSVRWHHLFLFSKPPFVGDAAPIPA
jgi:hypothetical protein